MPNPKRQRADSGSQTSIGNKTTRAAVACTRCRTKKLRCVGGAPCSSCKAAGAECVFDLGEEKLHRYLTGGDLQQRVSHLEDTVKVLTLRLDSIDHPVRGIPASTDGNDAQEQASGITIESVRPDESPGARLLAATAPRPGYVPPFPPLMFHPSIWENRSRSPSPEDGEGDTRSRLGPTLYEARVGVRDEPLLTGYVDRELAKVLYEFFFDLCLPAYPILPRKHKKDFDGMRQRSPFLFTVILAIACRFYRKHTDLHPTPDQPALSIAAIQEISRMAHAHLGASMFRKQHQVADVQAILLLSMYVLTGLGQSPDQWLLSGHCCRVGYRIGLDKAHLNSHSSVDREGTCERWQAWLAWYSYDGLLSLGFGRPQAVLRLVPDEMAFVNAVSVSTDTESASDDARFLASLVQLSTLGRHLIASTEGISVNSDCPLVIGTLARLHRQLDQWFAAWIPDTPGKSESMAELYGHHVRLCISSIALNISLSTDFAPIMIDQIALGERAASALIAKQAVLYASHDILFNDYARLIFAQAGVFLIRLLLPAVPFDIDRDGHKRSIQESYKLFSSYDITENGADQHFAHTLWEFCRMSNIELLDPPLDCGESSAHLNLEWLFGEQSSTDGVADINQLFGLPLGDWTSEMF